MIEVFKTNVQNESVAEEIRSALRKELPGSAIHFDLEDCDHVLRIEGVSVNPALVISTLKKRNVHCEVME
ncbi:MAG: hypothetical protein FD123_3378 [Bacteroidetes bacterium]|nr:MAG: hypothetical protein FD123_3378 [Bacteroidota bacterium]